jgi:hypothetical protein
MKDYGAVSPNFWTGKTGRKLKSLGAEAQLVALYLMTNPHRNALGLYYLPEIFITHETALDKEGASKGLQRCIEGGFCAYERVSETIWVYEMAHFQIGQSLKENDNKVKWINSKFDSLPNNKFLLPFLKKYKDDFHLKNGRNLKGLRRASKAPSKPDSDSDSDTDFNYDKKISIPKKIFLTEKMIMYANKKGVFKNLEDIFEAFCIHHKKKGSKFVDWNAAWQTWIRNHVDWKGKDNAREPKITTAKDVEAMLNG